MATTRYPGVRERHSRACSVSKGGKRCSGVPTCAPTYEASVGTGRRGGKRRKVFPTPAAALAWRIDTTRSVRDGSYREPSRQRVEQAARLLVFGMRLGAGEPPDKTGTPEEREAWAVAKPIRNRSGDPFKPSVIRSYEAALRLHVLPVLGGRRVGDVRRRDVQQLADDMIAAGADPATARNALAPLRVLYRRAVRDEVVAESPVTGVELPAARGRRDRIASPDEAGRLIGALREDDRALWGTAFYAGLRLGELRALLWSEIDLAGGVLRVEAALDAKGARIAPKSRAGRRGVPIPLVLRDLLASHKAATWSDGYVFGPSPFRPFTPSAVVRRARLRWSKASPVLRPIGMHEARHTYASLMIAAGVNAKALSVYMGHSSITITYDRYGHLMPGNESEAAELMDAFLARADTASRRRQVASLE
jgi:integrase